MINQKKWKDLICVFGEHLLGSDEAHRVSNCKLVSSCCPIIFVVFFFVFVAFDVKPIEAFQCMK